MKENGDSKMELIRGWERQYAPDVTGSLRGLTQESLLERLGSVDSDYAEPYSHATRGELCTTVIPAKVGIQGWGSRMGPVATGTTRGGSQTSSTPGRWST